jgi:transposase
MIVIGVDTHKRTHTLVALDAGTGAMRGELTIPARDAGTLEALRFGGGLAEERAWAIEDCRPVSGRLERALVASGERVIRVAPALTETSRRAARQPGKSDPIDAAAIARAALREGVERFPGAFVDEQAMEIRMLADYRDQLVSEVTRWINRLRWHLVALDPELEAELPPSALDGPRIRAKVARRLRRLPPSAQLTVAKAILKRISDLYREERELYQALKTLTAAHSARAWRSAAMRAG